MKYHTMQKGLACLLAAVLLCGTLTGCTDIRGDGLTDTARDENNKASVNAPIPLSGFEDVTDKSGSCSYQMVAELTDTYTFTCDKAASICVTTPSGKVEGEQKVQADITEGDTVTVEVTTEEAEQKFLLNAQADNHLQRLPYEANFTVDPATLDLQGDNTVQPDATEISYTKRAGGTYVYLNNPEKLSPADVGAAILRDEGLSGDVQVTWEHSNSTGQYIYLGYQLKNEGDEDVFVTVTNIGMQITGEWLGQRSWSDYYNYKFELPEDYFLDDGAVAERYVGQDFIDYTPRVYQPTTYRIPAGEHIYVLGGTSSDAYNNTNVADTADQLIFPGRCTNAVAKFFVTGGAVTGTFYCYTNPDQIADAPEEQGYIVERGGEQYGLQYKGVDYHQALIESNPVFIVNDQTPDGRLPVTYEQQSDPLASRRSGTPYAELKPVADTVDGNAWCTNINSNDRSRGIGTDMSSFECVTTDGETVTIDISHTDGTGAPANLGNWMIDYHDNITLVNQGDTARTFTINKQAQGALMTMVLDNEGTVLSTKCTIVPLEEPADERQWELYTVTVEPHSVVQLTVSFLLMGNSYGNVNHWIDVE